MSLTPEATLTAAEEAPRPFLTHECRKYRRKERRKKRKNKFDEIGKQNEKGKDRDLDESSFSWTSLLFTRRSC
jgi:hypothetical protein